jgi:hypothetical protein
MINSYRYGGESIIEKDGKKITIRVPPSIILRNNGAFINVTITHPRLIQEKLKEKMFLQLLLMP